MIHKETSQTKYSVSFFIYFFKQYRPGVARIIIKKNINIWYVCVAFRGFDSCFEVNVLSGAMWVHSWVFMSWEPEENKVLLEYSLYLFCMCREKTKTTLAENMNAFNPI